MKQLVTRHVLITGIVLAAFALPSPVKAQSADRLPNVFLDINGGYPLSSPAGVSTTLTAVSLYDESAEFRVGYQPARKVFVDARGGVRVGNRLAVGVGDLSLSPVARGHV